MFRVHSPIGDALLGVVKLGLGHRGCDFLQAFILIARRFGRDAAPGIGANVVAGNSPAVEVELAERALGFNIALVGSFFEPLGGFGVVLRNADAFKISLTEFPLGAGVALGGGLGEPCHGLAEILRQAGAVGVLDAHFVFGIGIAGIVLTAG